MTKLHAKLMGRWRKIADKPLLSGSHSPDGEMCVMEAVAYVAGEAWSDDPACACPIISAFMRRWNDDLDDSGRQMLKPYVVRLVGTKSTPEVEEQRGWLLADWLIRVHTPAWLELGGMKEQADAIRAFAPLRLRADLTAIQPILKEAREKANAAGAAAWDAARDATWAAAGAAAGAAAWDAAWDAARDATWAAAGDAAWDAARDATWAAAGAAAWDAARDATWAAAGAAAGAKLEPTKLSLQQSALALLDQLIECGK